MTQQSNHGRERFQLLLQQLNLTEDAIVSYFEHAEIAKLLIERSSQRWHFEFLIEEILPSDVHKRFSMQLIKTFSHIAQVTYTISVRNQNMTEKLIHDYWTDCLAEIDGGSPALLSLLNGQKPRVVGHKLVVNARNDAEAV